MADRRPAARMQLVEVEDAPRGRPVAPDGDPRPATPGPVAAAAACGRLRASCDGGGPGAAVVALGSSRPARGVGAGPRVRRAHRRGPRRGPPLDARARSSVGDRRPRWPAPCSRRRRARRAPESDRVWTVTSHDACPARSGGRVDLAPVSRSGFEATAAAARACARRGDLVVGLGGTAGAVLRRRVDPGAAARLGRAAVGAGRGTPRDGTSAGRLVAVRPRRGRRRHRHARRRGRMFVQRRAGHGDGPVDRHPGLWTPPSITVAATMRVLPPVVVLAGGRDDRPRRRRRQHSHGRATVRRAAGRRARRAVRHVGPVRRGHVHDVDGADAVRVQGLPAQLSADDGSESGDDHHRRGTAGVRGRRVDGAPAWRTPTQRTRGSGRRHRLVVVRRGPLRRAGHPDGSMVWDVDAGRCGDPVSDGALVLAPGVARRSPASSSGRGLHDGVRYWSVPLPEGASRVVRLGTHLSLSATTSSSRCGDRARPRRPWRVARHLGTRHGLRQGHAFGVR